MSMEVDTQLRITARRIICNTDRLVRLVTIFLISAFDFMFYYGWMLMLIPTSQVFLCSPIKVENKLLGTMFRLQATSDEILEEAYTNSECFRNNSVTLLNVGITNKSQADSGAFRANKIGR